MESDPPLAAEKAEGERIPGFKIGVDTPEANALQIFTGSATFELDLKDDVEEMTASSEDGAAEEVAAATEDGAPSSAVSGALSCTLPLQF